MSWPGLYSRRKLLFQNFVPIVVGTFISTLAGVFAMAGLNRVIEPAHELKVPSPHAFLWCSQNNVTVVCSWRL